MEAQTKGRCHYPPGPKSLLPGRLAFYMMRDAHGFMKWLGQEYGDIACARIGVQRICFVNHPDYIKEVLVKRYRDFDKGDAFHLMKSVFGKGLLTSEGEFHRRQRRLCQPAFHRNRIDAYSKAMVDSTAQTREQWHDGATIDVKAEMSQLSLMIATRTLFGVDVEAEEAKEVYQSIVEVLATWRFSGLALAHVLRRLHLQFPLKRKARRARDRMNDIIYRIIREKRANPEITDDLLSMLVHACGEEGDDDRMTDSQLRDEAMSFMMAGHETIAMTLTWTWYLLSRNPEAEQLLHQELDSVLGGRLPTVEDLPKLEYTRRVFLETMRLYPAGWVFSRKALHEVPIGDYILPKECLVITSPFVTHRRERYFPEPEQFKPDRWTPEFEAGLPEFAYFPFGGGVRRCIGEPFALVEGPLTIAAIAQKWRLRLVDDRQIGFERTFLLRPKGQVCMIAESRGVPTTTTHRGQDEIGDTSLRTENTLHVSSKAGGG